MFVKTAILLRHNKLLLSPSLPSLCNAEVPLYVVCMTKVLPMPPLPPHFFSILPYVQSAVDG